MINDRMIQFYMGLAENCGNMSRAVRAKVGTVIVKEDNILSFSWNGTPKGWNNACEEKVYLDPDTILTPEVLMEYPYEEVNDIKLKYSRYKLVTKPEVLHSERNAIDKLARSTYSSAGAMLFTTYSPCVECAKSIYGAEIAEVYYRHQYRLTEGLVFLNEVGVRCFKV